MADPAYYQSIKDIYDTDPDGRGFAGMSEEEFHTDIYQKDQDLFRTLSGAEVWRAVVAGDFLLLTDAQKSQWMTFCEQESIDLTASAGVDLAKDCFLGKDSWDNLKDLNKTVGTYADKLVQNETWERLPSLGDVQNAFLL